MWFVGLDVHRDTTAVCAVNGRGQVVRRVVVATTRPALRKVFARVRGRAKIACESGPMAPWVKSVLETRLREVIVCDRRRTRLSCTENKNDQFDAQKLAEFLRLGKLPAVYVPPPAEAAIRCLAYHHQKMVRERVRIVFRLRALFLMRGIRLVTRRSKPDRVPLHRLPDDASRHVASAYLLQLQLATTLVNEARSALIRSVETSPTFSLLQSIPYIGEIRAAELIAIVGEPSRFSSVRAFWAYGGLAVVQRVSGEHHIENGRIVREQRNRGVRLAKTGQPMLKKVLRDIALYSSIGRGEFRRIFDRTIARGKSPSLARIALARKIAAVILAVWRSGFAYDVSILRRKKNKQVSGRASVHELRFGGTRAPKARGLTICRPETQTVRRGSRATG